MSHQPETIHDPFDFARRALELTGTVDARLLPGLSDVIIDQGSAQMVEYSVTGHVRDGKCFLDIAATGVLFLQCQRCLGEVGSEVDAQSRLMLVPQGQDLPDDGLEDDDFDPIHAGVDFAVLAAIEEELLLALPLAPTHASCSVPAVKENGDDRSPFAALKGLKTRE